MDSRLRRSPPDRASASPMDKPRKRMRFPSLAHRSATLTSFTVPRNKTGLVPFRGTTKPTAGYRPLAYSSPKAVQITGAVAVRWRPVGSSITTLRKRPIASSC